MNIGQLKQLLATCRLPDSARVLLPGSDHDFRNGDARMETVAWSREYGTWSEDFGPMHRTGDEVPVKALVIS